MEEEISPTIPLHRFIAVAKVKSSMTHHKTDTVKVQILRIFENIKKLIGS